MRIVAGTLRGRAIVAPADSTIRPTSDRVRESVFNILAHGVPDFTLEGARVIDLFAGTGALGLEAISRGAGFCLFVDNGAEARGLIRTNVEAFGLTGVTRLFRRGADDLGPMGRGEAYDLAFLDPPYGKDLADRALASLVDGGWLKPGSVVVVEERAGVTVSLPSGLTQFDTRIYGDTEVHFARGDVSGET
jgi:16S rRNA (guanine966-N2)-methyltransferase